MDIRNTTLDDLAAVIGFSATLRLAAWFGDAGNLYVPLTATADQLPAKLIGLPAALRLSAAWPGAHISVPRLRSYETDLRRAAIAKLLQRNMSPKEIGRVLNMGERRVQQVRRDLEAAGLSAVFAPGSSAEKNSP